MQFVINFTKSKQIYAGHIIEYDPHKIEELLEP